MDFFKNLNWVDILVAVVFARIIFISIKTGFIIEFFKFLGALFATFFTLHYYSQIADWLIPYTSVFKPEAITILVFLVLWCIVTFLMKFTRDGMLALFSIQPHPLIDKWGSVCVGVIRGFIICSLTFYTFLLSQNAVIVKLCERSWSKYAVSHLATHIYYAAYDGAVVKFFPLEHVNQQALAVPQLIEQKKK